MNYYPFHVGDYLTHTRHLTPMEDLAYRRMLDLYYIHEAPLPADPKAVARLIALRENVDRLTGVQVCRRLVELERAGRVRPTGRLVSSTAGRQEREWEVA